MVSKLCMFQMVFGHPNCRRLSRTPQRPPPLPPLPSCQIKLHLQSAKRIVGGGETWEQGFWARRIKYAWLCFGTRLPSGRVSRLPWLVIVISFCTERGLQTELDEQRICGAWQIQRFWAFGCSGVWPVGAKSTKLSKWVSTGAVCQIKGINNQHILGVNRIQTVCGDSLNESSCEWNVAKLHLKHSLMCGKQLHLCGFNFGSFQTYCHFTI